LNSKWDELPCCDLGQERPYRIGNHTTFAIANRLSNLDSVHRSLGRIHHLTNHPTLSEPRIPRMATYPGVNDRHCVFQRSIRPRELELRNRQVDSRGSSGSTGQHCGSGGSTSGGGLRVTQRGTGYVRSRVEGRNRSLYPTIATIHRGARRRRHEEGDTYNNQDEMQKRAHVVSL
jgi:hypothetical protein